ncbi:MAG: hypothetical protein WAK50_12270 [Nitrososphaeraceae archaeon]
MQNTKVDVLLPKKYKNNSEIEGYKFAETFDEIFNEFGGCTADNSPLLGSWFNRNTQKRDNDELISYWVICDYNLSSYFFFNEMKRRLAGRFEQDEIFMYSSEVAVF